MKWYSVKKYNPPMDVTCLIFTVNNYFYLGKLISGDDYSQWAVDYYCMKHGEDSETIYGVTHFCILDPIEVEE